MKPSRLPQKVERLTVRLEPSGDARVAPSVPSTFSPENRTYEWQTAGQFDLMMVPTRISNQEIIVDIFVAMQGRHGRVTHVTRAITDFVNAKLASEWHGLRLMSVSKPTMALPPTRVFRRATIEEILGGRLGS